MSAVDVVAAMKSGSLPAERYALALLEQCERGKALNAFITLDRERVLAAARAADQRRRTGGKLGPLHGLPIPIKDSVNTNDLRTTVGTPALRGFQPKEYAPLVRTLRAAGAIVLGKTNPRELSLGWTSNNQAFGAVHNPYDPTRIPGGSSRGTPAALLMSSLQARVQVLFDDPTNLADLVTRLNRIISSNCPSNRFITFFIGVLDPKKGELTYVNAGHNPPFLAHADGSVEKLEGAGLILGILPSAKYEQGLCRLEPAMRCCCSAMASPRRFVQMPMNNSVSTI